MCCVRECCFSINAKEGAFGVFEQSIQRKRIGTGRGEARKCWRGKDLMQGVSESRAGIDMPSDAFLVPSLPLSVSPVGGKQVYSLTNGPS